jgi:hypothetical protein
MENPKVNYQWPLTAKSNKFFFNIFLLVSSGLISGLLTAIIVQITDFLPNPNFKIWDIRIGGEIIPLFFTWLTSFLWLIYRNKTTPVFLFFNFLSKKNFFIIIIAWYMAAILSFYTIGISVSDKIITSIPKEYTPLHKAVQVGEMVGDESNKYYVFNNDIILRVKKGNNNWINLGKESEAEKTEWWWDKKKISISDQDKYLLSSIDIDKNNSSTFSLSIAFVILAYIYLSWILSDLNFIFINAPIIWWKSRWKKFMPTSLQLFNLYKSNNEEYTNWINTIPPTEQDKIFVSEVITQIEKVSSKNYDNSEKEVILKINDLANLEPSYAKENLLSKTIGKIDAFKEYFD